MKHLNIKIALLALAPLLATGHSMANESGLSSANSSAGNSSYFIEAVDSERLSTSKLFPSSDLTDSPFLLVKKCTIDGEKGKFCKTLDECLPRGEKCLKKEKSPHDRDPEVSDKKSSEKHGI